MKDTSNLEKCFKQYLFFFLNLFINFLIMSILE